MLDEPETLVEPALEEELRRLARNYAAGVDRRDRALFLSSFHPDATLTVVRPADETDTTSATIRGHTEIGAITDAIAKYRSTFHFLGQSGYALTDAGAAGEIHCIAHHRWTEHAELDHVMYIRYTDDYRLADDDRWRITSRTVLVDWTETRVLDVPGRTAR
jgi:hypothetical protein